MKPLTPEEPSPDIRQVAVMLHDQNLHARSAIIPATIRPGVVVRLVPDH